MVGGCRDDAAPFGVGVPELIPQGLQAVQRPRRPRPLLVLPALDSELKLGESLPASEGRRLLTGELTTRAPLRPTVEYIRLLSNAVPVPREMVAWAVTSVVVGTVAPKRWSES